MPPSSSEADLFLSTLLESGRKVISYPGTSQYAVGGVSACGLAAMGFAKFCIELFETEPDRTLALYQLSSKDSVDQIMSICSQRGENESHLEVSAIYNMPFFLDSIERGGTDQVLAKEHELAKLVGALHRGKAGKAKSSVLILTRPPEIIACARVGTPEGDIFVIFDSHPRVKFPDGSGMLFFTASEDAVNYLTVTFAVDFDLDDPSLSWHAQCAAQVSGDLFFVRGEAWTKKPSPTEDKGKGKEKENVGMHRHRPIPTSSYAAEMSQPPFNDITRRRTQDMPGPSQKPDRMRCYQPKNSQIQAAAQIQQIERLKTPQRKPDYEAHSMPSDPSADIPTSSPPPYSTPRFRSHALADDSIELLAALEDDLQSARMVERQILEEKEAFECCQLITRLHEEKQATEIRIAHERQQMEKLRAEEAAATKLKRKEAKRKLRRERAASHQDVQLENAHPQLDARESRQTVDAQTSGASSSTRGDSQTQRRRAQSSGYHSSPMSGYPLQQEAEPSLIAQERYLPVTQAYTAQVEDDAAIAQHLQEEYDAEHEVLKASARRARGLQDEYDADATARRIFDEEDLSQEVELTRVLPHDSLASLRLTDEEQSRGKGSDARPLVEDVDLKAALRMQMDFDEEDRMLAATLATLRTGPSQETFDCNVCLDTQSIEDRAIIPQCNHVTCRNCLRTQVETTIKDNKYPVYCPACGTDEGQSSVIDHDVVGVVGISEEVFAKFQELALATFSVDVTCPRCRCTVKIDREEYMKTNELTCLLECGYNWCKHCNQEIPPGIEHSCDGQREMDALAKQNDWKQCPGCGNLVQKDGGCNHITCVSRGCNTHFCYTCGKTLWRSPEKPEPDVLYAHWRQGECTKPLYAEEDIVDEPIPEREQEFMVIQPVPRHPAHAPVLLRYDEEDDEERPQMFRNLSYRPPTPPLRHSLSRSPSPAPLIPPIPLPQRNALHLPPAHMYLPPTHMHRRHHHHHHRRHAPNHPLVTPPALPFMFVPYPGGPLPHWRAPSAHATHRY